MAESASDVRFPADPTIRWRSDEDLQWIATPPILITRE
jgi:hypothetical protein